MDWVATLAQEAKTNPVLRIRDLATKYSLSTSAVAKALQRQKRRGLLESLVSDTYLNKLAVSAGPRDVVNKLVPGSYISLGTALAEWGLSSQNPIATTCVTPTRGRKIKSASIDLLYRKISPDLFWGFVEKKARYSNYRIAEAEKALLDWIYFHLKDGLPVQLDEIQFDKLSRSRLVAYAKKYPSTVIQTLFLPLLEGQITGLRP